MKKLFIIANWKSNKTIEETEYWLHSFSEGLKREGAKIEGKKIIIALSFTSLEHANYCSCNLKLPIKLAAQNISPFDEGAYTGEVSAKQIKELADYVIVGHSERRKNFGEDDKMVNQKIEQVLKHRLIPILCVSNLEEAQKSILRQAQDESQNYPLRRSSSEASSSKVKSYDNKIIVAYEPLFAIGSGQPDTPQNADIMAQSIKKELGETPVLYGGSVTSDNVKSFTSMPHIDGVLVGGASLDPLEFLKIIKNA